MRHISKAVYAALVRIAHVKNLEFQDVFRGVLANGEALPQVAELACDKKCLIRADREFKASSMTCLGDTQSVIQEME